MSLPVQYDLAGRTGRKMRERWEFVFLCESLKEWTNLWSRPAASPRLVGSQLEGGGAPLGHTDSYWSWGRKAGLSLAGTNEQIWLAVKHIVFLKVNQWKIQNTALWLAIKNTVWNVIGSDQRKIPRLSTCAVARKSPVGDMDTPTGAIATRKQSTRLKRQKCKGDVANKI